MLGNKFARGRCKEMKVRCPYCNRIVTPIMSTQLDFDEKYKFKTGICSFCQEVLSSEELDDNIVLE
jgi:aspartate carbamoyltransferase regulatory subunit